MEALTAAVRCGADAVYLGQKNFSARKNSQNFDGEELREAVAYAHRCGVKIHQALNIVVFQQELEALKACIRTAVEAGVDAMIVQDWGVAALVRRFAPDMPLHASTQMAVHSPAGAKLAEELGFSRVVLARELTREEIEAIVRSTSLETEIFVHGAHCMSVSGQCYLSAALGGKSGNRGQCAQPCRWKYALMEEKRPGQYFPVFEDEEGTYILNAKDLCLLPYIDKLAAAGVTSLKIEGRAKSAYYVAAVTNAYRIAVDDFYARPEGWQLPGWLSDEVRKVSHRDYSAGFLFGRPEAGQRYEQNGYIRLTDVAAVVEKVEGGRVYCTQKNRFFDGDTLELLEPGKQPVPFTVTGLQNGDGEPISDTRHPAMAFSFPLSLLPHPPAAGSMIRKNLEG